MIKSLRVWLSAVSVVVAPVSASSPALWISLNPFSNFVSDLVGTCRQYKCPEQYSYWPNAQSHVVNNWPGHHVPVASQYNLDHGEKMVMLCAWKRNCKTNRSVIMAIHQTLLYNPNGLSGLWAGDAYLTYIQEEFVIYYLPLILQLVTLITEETLCFLVTHPAVFLLLTLFRVMRYLDIFVRWPLFCHRWANAVEQSAWTALATGHHLRTIPMIVENVYVWLVKPRRPVSER